MKSLCIKSNNPNYLNYLLDRLKTINIDDVYFSCNEFKSYKNIIIHYKGLDTPSFLFYISDILSNLVIDEFDETIIKKYIYYNHFYFNKLERDEIFKLCLELNSANPKYYDNKYSILFKNFYNYIATNKSLVLSGFIDFRLKDYCNEIEELVDEAVNQFVVEREYNEFISLLKLYISSQAGSSCTIHLIYLDNYSLLLDEDKNIINISDDIFKTKYLSDISFSFNDYILNSLLTLLPSKIYIHLINNNYDEFIHTLQLIFGDRIHLCTDCSICNLYKTINKTSLKQ